MNEHGKVCSRPISRSVALVLWTALVGGAFAISMMVLPRAGNNFEQIGVALPALTTAILAAGQWMLSYWYAALGGYLLGVVVIGARALDRFMSGVIALLSLATAGMAVGVAAGILIPLYNLSQAVG